MRMRLFLEARRGTRCQTQVAWHQAAAAAAAAQKSLAYQLEERQVVYRGLIGLRGYRHFNLRCKNLLTAYCC
jgi:hypothetical protein